MLVFLCQCERETKSVWNRGLLRKKEQTERQPPVSRRGGGVSQTDSGEVVCAVSGLRGGSATIYNVPRTKRATRLTIVKSDTRALD